MADDPVEGELIFPSQDAMVHEALSRAAAKDLARREDEARRDSDLRAARRPLGPNDVVVKPFGWEPTGRLAEYANRRNPDDYLSPEAVNLIMQGVPENTRTTYRIQWKKYVRWCGETGRVECPASPATVIEYMNHLWRTPGRRGRPTAPSSVKLALAVIAVAHQRAPRPERDERGQVQFGYVSPTKHPDVQAAVRGYTRQWLLAGHRPDVAYPISPDDLAKMVATLDARSVVGVQKATMLTVGYKMGARRSELPAINLDDVDLMVAGQDPEEVTAEDSMVIHIAMSKTDQAGDGADVVLYGHPAAEALTCPVRWTLRWLQWRREQQIPQDGPFMLVVITGRPAGDDRPRKGKIQAGKRINGVTLENLLAEVAAKAGVDDAGGGGKRRVVWHGMRAGPATYAAESGADTPALNRHFRWSPRGTTAQRYVRGGNMRRLNPMRRLYEERAARRRERRDQGEGQ